jgi:predicted RNA-binding protein with PUA-like domain
MKKTSAKQPGIAAQRDALARHWLVKSEPHVFSFDDLWRAPKRTTAWDGVRNAQARNSMRDAMRVGDGVLFYHSSCDEPAVVGVCEVASAPYPDPTQFDPDSPYFDGTSDAADPRWILVDVRARARLVRPVTLVALKADPRLAGFGVVQKGSRLSVMPVMEAHWRVVLELGATKDPIS